jgi:hypothetical protein
MPADEDTALAKDVAFAVKSAVKQSDLIRALTKEVQGLRGEVATLRNRLTEVESTVLLLAKSSTNGTAPAASWEECPDSGWPKQLHRGENNRRMDIYAQEIGAGVVAESHRRCNFCRHVNGRFVRKGEICLCQDCFAKGVRF